MIAPRGTATVADVARHYDELDEYYRRLWGEHVHHGLWLRGNETPEEAVVQLVDHLAARLELKEGEHVCDIGCGYGATARLLARQYGARVVGFTISEAQYEFARTRINGSDNPRFLLRDWTQNGFPDACFDAAFAIESCEHVLYKALFFSEAFRVLRPGGRFGLYVWLTKDAPAPWVRERLIEPICEEGRLAGIGSVADYEGWLGRAGFTDIRYEPLGPLVRKTWTVCLRRMAASFLRDARARRFLFHGPANRVFAKTVVRIWCAYHLGAMEYGLFTARKPARWRPFAQ